jgi:hypothetical protein
VEAAEAAEVETCGRVFRTPMECSLLQMLVDEKFAQLEVYSDPKHISWNRAEWKSLKELKITREVLEVTFTDEEDDSVMGHIKGTLFVNKGFKFDFKNEIERLGYQVVRQSSVIHRDGFQSRGGSKSWCEVLTTMPYSHAVEIFTGP